MTALTEYSSRILDHSRTSVFSRLILSQESKLITHARMQIRTFIGGVDFIMRNIGMLILYDTHICSHAFNVLTDILITPGLLSKLVTNLNIPQMMFWIVQLLCTAAGPALLAKD